MNSPASPLPEPPNNRCFACGSRNRHGLRLRFATDGDHGVTAAWRPEVAWEGFRGVIHGGVISTVLDEAMSKAVAAAGIRALTCELRVRLHQRVEVAEELQIRGWVVERRKRRIVTEATRKDSNALERAHAWATFLEPQR
jgi:acyl-coenzyme A thioesterase PaaI-like protein